MKGIDCSSVRIVRVHKEQFDAIDKKATALIITCAEDGRCIAFNRDKGVDGSDEEIRTVTSDEDCADCLCRVCARNKNNDSYNHKLENGHANCECNCNIGDKLIETEDDCPDFLPDEE